MTAPTRPTKERLIAFAIDFFIICLIQGIAFQYILLTATTETNIMPKIMLCNVITACLLLGKDIIQGRSIGKRIMKIAVTRSNGERPGLIRSIIRNLTLPFWPIEALVFLSSGGASRLGDKLTKTEVRSQA